MENSFQPDPPAIPPGGNSPWGRAKVLPIIRDIVFIYVLLFVSVGVAGLVSPRFPPDSQWLLLVILWFISLLGFAISACSAGSCGRWRHLAFVALGLLPVSGFYRMLFFDNWMLSAAAFGLMAAGGGALSYVFKRDPKPSAESQNQTGLKSRPEKPAVRAPAPVQWFCCGLFAHLFIWASLKGLMSLGSLGHSLRGRVLSELVLELASISLGVAVVCSGWNRRRWLAVGFAVPAVCNLFYLIIK